MKIRMTAREQAQVYLAAGRTLSLLTLLLLVVMPITEHLWHFDGLVCGGQDFEFGLLAALIFLCLVLVMSQHSHRTILMLMHRKPWHPVFPSFLNSRHHRFVAALMAAAETAPASAISLGAPYTLPIQI